MPIEPSDDHYDILGIEQHADAATLRRAYRRLALRWHPDRAGSAATPIFQRIAAAYMVLSNPAARALYDLQRRPRPSGEPPAPPASEPPRRRAPGVMLRRLTGPLNALLAVRVARVADDGVIELFVNDAEAAQGGMVTISMRVPVDRNGSVAEELFSAWLAVPPGATDGTMLIPSAQLHGVVKPVAFRVRRA